MTEEYKTELLRRLTTDLERYESGLLRKEQNAYKLLSTLGEIAKALLVSHQPIKG